MNWSLLAGGVSQGVNNALEGANKGLLQGEQIRSGRAQEGLAQQSFGLQEKSLGLQEQQLKNTLAQQDFMNRLARERYGFEREKFGADQEHQAWGRKHGDELRGIQGAEFGLKQEAFPYDRDLTKAKTAYYSDPARRGGVGKGGFEERFKHDAAKDAGFESYFEAPPDVQATINRAWQGSRPDRDLREAHNERQKQLVPVRLQLLQYALANPPQSGADQARTNMAYQQGRLLQGALSRAGEAGAMGLPVQPQDQKIIDTIDFQQVINSLLAVQRSVSTRGFNAANPGQTAVPFMPPAQQQPVTLDQARRALGLR